MAKWTGRSLLKSQSITRRLLLSSRLQHDGSAGGMSTGESDEGNSGMWNLDLKLGGVFSTGDWRTRLWPVWQCSSSGSRLRLCSHNYMRGSALDPLLLTHSCQNRHRHGFSCCPWAQAVLPCRGAGCQRTVLNHGGRGTSRLWSIFYAIFCSCNDRKRDLKTHPILIRSNSAVVKWSFEGSVWIILLSST